MLILILIFSTLAPVRDQLMQEGRALINALEYGLEHHAAIRRNIRNPRSGESVLPVPVRDMIALIREHHLPNYRFSPNIGNDALLRQRLVEGAWPVRFAPDSPHLLLLASERTACALREARNEVLLADCSD